MRLFLMVFGFISVLILATASVQAAQPNVLLLFADDQRADTISAWGNPNIQTPHLDALVNRGVSFRENYCHGANSGAVCVPSRAMLHTGKMWMHIHNDMRDQQTLGQTLGNAGYRTFCTGKWHNGPASILRSFQSGEAIYMGGMSDHLEVPLQDIVDGKLVNKRIGEGFSSEMFADSVISFLESTTNDDKPFFAYAAFTAPHDPRQPVEPFRRHYYENRPPLPPNFLPQHPFDHGMLVLRDENLAPWPRTADVVGDQLAEYYGLIAHLDAQIGRVIAALEKTEKAENTIIVYAADHGLAMGSHGLLGKQSIYEHSMKCPLIICGPGIKGGQSSNAFTYLLDIYPTLCELTGVAGPEDLFGQSLVTQLSQPEKPTREHIALPFYGTMRSMRDEQFKVIYYPKINHVQLFDLKNDPHETLNLAGHPDYQDAKNRLTMALKQWQSDVGDETPLTSAKPKPLYRELTGTPRKPDRWQPKWIIEKYFDGVLPTEKNQAATAKMRKEFGGKQ